MVLTTYSTYSPKAGWITKRGYLRNDDQKEYRRELSHQLKELRSYGNVGKDLAIALLDEEKFTPKYYWASDRSFGDKTAGLFLKHGKFREFAKCLCCGGFGNLDADIATALIENGEALSVLLEIKRFTKLNQNLVEKIIEDKSSGGYWPRPHESSYSHKIHFLFKKIDEFEGIDYKKLLEKLLKNSYGLNHFGKEVKLCLEKLQRFDKEIAENLIENEYGKYVVDFLYKFKGLNHKKIVKKLIEKGEVECVVNNLNKFKGLDKEIWIKLLKLGYKTSIMSNLHSFGLGLAKE